MPEVAGVDFTAPRGQHQHLGHQSVQSVDDGGATDVFVAVEDERPGLGLTQLLLQLF